MSRVRACVRASERPEFAKREFGVFYSERARSESIMLEPRLLLPARFIPNIYMSSHLSILYSQFSNLTPVTVRAWVWLVSEADRGVGRERMGRDRVERIERVKLKL